MQNSQNCFETLTKKRQILETLAHSHSAGTGKQLTFSCLGSALLQKRKELRYTHLFRATAQYCDVTNTYGRRWQKANEKKKLIRLTFRLQNYRLLSEFLQQKTVNSKRLVMYNKMRNQGKQKIIYQKRNLSRKIGVS